MRPNKRLQPTSKLLRSFAAAETYNSAIDKKFTQQSCAAERRR